MVFQASDSVESGPSPFGRGWPEGPGEGDEAPYLFGKGVWSLHYHAVWNSQYLIAKFVKAFVPACVFLNLLGIIVNDTVKLDNQTKFLAVEVDNKAVNRNLTSKLESEHATIPQHDPSELFGPSILVSHVARPLQDFAWNNFAAHRPNPHPALRATLSRRERDSAQMQSDGQDR
jgi:hypothetical protein